MKSTSTTPRLHIIVDRVRTTSPEVRGIFSGWQWEQFKPKLIRAGFDPNNVIISLDSDALTLPQDASVILTLGERPLSRLTGKKSVEKYHMTPVLGKDGKIIVPTYDLGQVNKQYEMHTMQEMALGKCAKYLRDPKHLTQRRENFFLNPPLEETLSILNDLTKAECVAVDVETGYGQINTVGFAWSPEDAIAINVLPDRLGAKNLFNLFEAIRAVMEGPSQKVFQNFIYDTSYFSAYGITTNNIFHDTMFAQKVLWPEFRSNLGMVGRIYTDRAYWKDDGKTQEEEEEKKDWGNVRDWRAHYLYNCRDTSGTFEAHRAQREDLERRGLLPFFRDYIMQLPAPIAEMCARGMPLDLKRREELKSEIEEELKTLTEELHKEAGMEFNPKSPKQKLEWLKSQKVKIPKKFDKATGKYKESTDSTSLKKLRLKHPKLTALTTLLKIGTKQKALSSYIDFIPRPDGRLSFSINGTGTETLRFSGGKDPWGRGINIQTMPREGSDVSIKSMFVAPEGESFMEVDLSAAESRFVAYASADAKLIQMLEDGEDVHKHVAMNLLKALGKSPSEYSKKWRNLAKPVGHGGNYLMKAGTLAENIFKMMEISIPKEEAETMLEAYHAEFPRIRIWQQEIKQQLWRKRRLRAPSGWERYFYGRPDDQMWREGIAWTPQHTIPWITNHLMFHILEEREAGRLNFNLIAQVHDSLILTCPDAEIERITRSCVTLKNWAPKIELPGGSLVIPVDCEWGKSLADKEPVRL